MNTPIKLIERSDIDLFSLCLELYARSSTLPQSEELHNNSVDAQNEMLKRLNANNHQIMLEALKRIVNDCTARKAVMIARAAISKVEG